MEVDSHRQVQLLDLVVIIEREAEPSAGYSAYCPSVPGCYSNGTTFEDALANMREAVEQHLRALLAERDVISLEQKKVRVEELSIVMKR